MRLEKFRLSNSLKNASDINFQAKMIQDTLYDIEGVNIVRVNTFENTITIDYNEVQISSSKIQQKLKENNYM